MEFSPQNQRNAEFGFKAEMTALCDLRVLLFKNGIETEARKGHEGLRMMTSPIGYSELLKVVLAIAQLQKRDPRLPYFSAPMAIA